MGGGINGHRVSDPACLQSVEVGETGCDQPSQRRWYYSDLYAECIVFAYTGCGGNDNNFASIVECEQHCKRTPGIERFVRLLSTTHFHCKLRHSPLNSRVPRLFKRQEIISLACR